MKDFITQGSLPSATSATIGLWLGGVHVCQNRVWALLGSAFNVLFVDRTVAQDTGSDHGRVYLNAAGFGGPTNVPSLRIESPSGWVSRNDKINVSFMGSAILPPWIRGANFVGECSGPVSPLQPTENEEVVCRYQDGPLWVCKREGDVAHHRVALPVYSLGEQEGFFDKVSILGFLQALALFTFLGETTGESVWHVPSIQAAFVFDDPNLHWPSYGYLNFARLAQDAWLHNYHVAIATIPLDSYYASKRSVDIFRKNPRQLSLLVHGNDHTRRELATRISMMERQRNLRLAQRRISFFERRTGLAVDRVIAPPHGGISEDAVCAIGLSGFEAVVTSLGTLRRYNADRPWLPNIGVSPADFIAKVPSLPRLGLSTASKTHVAMALLMRMPVIFSGHHEDLADGIDILNNAAKLVNGFGDVVWCGLADVCRRNYLFHFTSDTMCVRMFSLHVRVILPDALRWIRVESPMWASRVEYIVDSSRKGCVAIGESLDITGAKSVEFVVLLASNASNVPVTSFGGFSAWPMTRRILCEVRDRTRPVWERVRCVSG